MFLANFLYNIWKLTDFYIPHCPILTTILWECSPLDSDPWRLISVVSLPKQVDMWANPAVYAARCNSFFYIRFSNNHPFCDQLFTVFIAPNTSFIPFFLSREHCRCLKLQLFHRFIFLRFNKIFQDSFDGVIIDVKTFYLRFGMVVSNQPEERTLLCLKRHDWDMGCSRCILLSILCYISNVQGQTRDSS